MQPAEQLYLSNQKRFTMTKIP